MLTNMVRMPDKINIKICVSKQSSTDKNDKVTLKGDRIKVHLHNQIQG